MRCIPETFSSPWEQETLVTSNMRSIDSFPDITSADEPLGPHTWFRLGGPAQYLIRPRSFDELAEVVRCCHEQQIPIRMLGGGSNLLVRDEGVSGAVIHLTGDYFNRVEVVGKTVKAGAGAALSHAIGEAVRAGLGGLDALVGIPGSVGGALVGNAGGRAGDVGQFVSRVEVMTYSGETSSRSADELAFEYRRSNLHDVIVLSAVFELQPEDADVITRRMRKLWIMKKATQPLSSQSAGCIFKNPRGMSAGSLIDQAGLKGTRIGGAEISDRHANFIVTHPGAKSQDVLRLIDLARSKVNEQFGIDLELEVQVW